MLTMADPIKPQSEINMKDQYPKDVARLAIYLVTYKDSKKIKGSMTEHSIYEFGRRLANSLNIYFEEAK